MKENEENNSSGKINRRDVLKGLVAVPFVGAIAYGLVKRQMYYEDLSQNLLENIKVDIPDGLPSLVPGEKIKIGFIGCGERGSYLMKALGFVRPESIDTWTENAITDKDWKAYLEGFLSQDDLNVEITAICDIFDINAEKAQKAGANIHRNGSKGEMGVSPERYLTYKELIANADVDAIVVAAPDHWHVPIAMEGAKYGKHVYCEKPLSWTVPETYEIRKVVKDSGIVFQLGHQGRQTESYNVAKSLIEQGVIGKVSLIEVCTNRNSPNGAWVYTINPEASPENIDWKQFIGPAPWHDFSLPRFFRWRCWWDYSTGLSGDLFTHEFDAMNQILGLGIPESAMSSGGFYYFKDGRTVPDVLQMSYEYPSKNLTLLYSATLASSKNRGKVIMGHDGNMEISNTLIVNADRDSTRYAEKIQNGVIDPSKPIFSYVPGRNKVDAITTATEKYFAGRGLLYTYRGGKQVDTSHLHLREWLNCIRKNNGEQPSCNIDMAFEEAIAAHMGTISYHENRKTFWDSEKEEIV